MTYTEDLEETNKRLLEELEYTKKNHCAYWEHNTHSQEIGYQLPNP
jgi:hypothetical protein